MEVKLEIEKYRYNDIKMWCEVNSININEYMLDAINEKFMIDKFGDLNDKIKPKKVINKVNNNTEVTVKEEEKKVKKEEKEVPVVEVKTPNIEKEVITNEVRVKKENHTRILKSK